MIAIDTSALMAIFLNEPDRERFTKAMFDAGMTYVGAPTALEFVMVAQSRRGAAAGSEPENILSRPGLRIEPWTDRHLAIARKAFTRYGKGQGHPAQLNFGDCMSYALARSLDAPLLYKGDDFRHTDIVAAL